MCNEFQAFKRSAEWKLDFVLPPPNHNRRPLPLFVTFASSFAVPVLQGCSPGKGLKVHRESFLRYCLEPSRAQYAVSALRKASGKKLFGPNPASLVRDFIQDVVNYAAPDGEKPSALEELMRLVRVFHFFVVWLRVFKFV